MTTKLQTPHYRIIFQKYDIAVRAKGYKAGEKGNMQRMVEEFLLFMEYVGIRHVKRISTQDMIDYYGYLSERPNKRRNGTLSSSSLSDHFHALDFLYQTLLEEKVIDKAIIFPRLINREKTERNILTVDEIKYLFKVSESLRDKAILNLAYGMGLRRTEIQDLQVADVQLNRGILIVREGKGKKRRELPLPESIISDLKDYLLIERPKYLKENKTGLIESFLVNNKGKPMKGDHINDRLKELIEKSANPEIKAKGITLHCLRHSIAAHFLDKGADMEFVRGFLGHAMIDTVHIYAKKRKLKDKLFR